MEKKKKQQINSRPAVSEIIRRSKLKKSGMRQSRGNHKQQILSDSNKKEKVGDMFRCKSTVYLDKRRNQNLPVDSSFQR